jgi:uncharacterized protein YhbP (UPF0306 family)
MNAQLAHEIASFLAAHHVLSLATGGANGPHATNLFYACDGLALVWVSDPESRHSREIDTDSRVAATVAPDYSDFAAIKGLQIAGTARRILAPDGRAQHLARIEARYPFLRNLAAGPPALREAYSRTAVYRLQPARMVLIDNAKGFGHKQTLDLVE